VEPEFEHTLDAAAKVGRGGGEVAALGLDQGIVDAGDKIMHHRSARAARGSDRLDDLARTVELFAQNQRANPVRQ
jgi:hypothetical protein